jgi:GNAT superfamily N-acetyltransferase
VYRMAALGARRSASLHASELPDGFFADLGPRFLRAYHDAFRRSPYGIALVAHSDRGILGFVVGAVDEQRHLAWIVRHRAPHLLLAATLALISRPALAVRFLRTRANRYARGGLRLLRGRIRTTESTGPQVATGVAGVLSHVAVDPLERGRGVGAALVDAFVREATIRGASRVRTMTRADADGAGGFYLSLGWRRVGSRPDLDGAPYDHFEIAP